MHTQKHSKKLQPKTLDKGRNAIQSLISKQQQNIGELLRKYGFNDYKKYQFSQPSQKNYHQFKTISDKNSNTIKQSKTLDISRSSTGKIEEVVLPNIKNRNRSNRQKLSPQKQQYLKKVYGNIKFRKIGDNQQQIKKPQSTKKQTKISSLSQRQILTNYTKENQKQLNKLNSKRKAQQESENQSSESQPEFGLKQYNSLFQQTIKTQNFQQINFLYFSRNQQMKNWTDNLLSIFERHDKQIAILKKKCHYLQTFDPNFYLNQGYDQN